ncbi:hypothetical protein [Rhodococcus kronopolitis]|uniref:DUF4878 domain-containing protein n=1 Tax=Rhodococcus kronopolitis TaxID=1460226 RepID=A0ABV9FVT5_9NOCA
MSTVSTSPRRGRRVAAFALGALAVVAVASGCSSSEDSSSDATADQTAVVDTLSSYYSAFGADDGPKACGYLDPELAAKLATTGPDGTCESAVNAGHKNAGAEALTKLSELKYDATKVVVEGDTAKLSTKDVAELNGKATDSTAQIVLTRDGDNWKIVDLG